MAKYVPPHKRNVSTSILTSTPRNHNFLPENKFNVQTNQYQVIKEISPIEIPETIVPHIVEPPISQTSETIPIKRVISDKEISILKATSKIRSQYMNKEKSINYNEWVEHYDEYLKDMYHVCVNPDLECSYDDFVRLAFECTNTEFNRSKFKYERPLI